jgi:dihydroorotase
MTAAPAHEIRHDELGNLSIGAPADLAAFSIDQGKFGFVDMNNQRKDGAAKIVCQLTIRGGKVVYDLNGISSDVWNGQPTSDYKLARYWTTMMTRDENKKAKSANAPRLTSTAK